VSAGALPAVDETAITTFNVYLPLTHTDALDQLLREQTDASSPNYHHWLTPAQFKEQFGPDRSVVAQVSALLRAEGFTVVAEKTQSLEVQGPVSVVERAFSTKLENVRSQNGSLVLGAVDRRFTMPVALKSLGAIIPEFSPYHEAHVHSARVESLAGANPLTRLSSSALYYPNDLKEAYLFPSFQTEVTPPGGSGPVQIAGVGAHIGIVISSIILPSDLKRTFNSVLDLNPSGTLIQNYSGNSNLPVPTVSIRKVAGGSGPFNPQSGDAVEASLDTQMSLGTAPGATETLYDMPNLYSASIIAAYQAVDEDNIVDVVSSSFGGCELEYTAPYNGGVDYTYILTATHRLFQQGNAQGITFVASSGDNGAVPCLSTQFVNNPTNGTNYVLGVENPADDPNVTAVGGTNLQTTATPGVNDATYASENADYDPRLPASFQVGSETVTVGNNTWGSGGGISSIFPRPIYQSQVNTGSTTYRTVPDVSLMMGGCPSDADLSVQDCTMLPRSAVIVWFAGEPAAVIGTSASAPEMAGVIALAVQVNGGRVGNFNPTIYSLAQAQTAAGGINAPAAEQYFHEDISGNNNGYTVSPNQGYSLVLGNGTLNVKTFLGLQSAKKAGAPNTPSNP